jgi:hypothetical protein
LLKLDAASQCAKEGVPADLCLFCKVRYRCRAQSEPGSTTGYRCEYGQRGARSVMLPIHLKDQAIHRVIDRRLLLVFTRPTNRGRIRRMNAVLSWGSELRIGLVRGHAFTRRQPVKLYRVWILKTRANFSTYELYTLQTWKIWTFLH